MPVPFLIRLETRSCKLTEANSYFDSLRVDIGMDELKFRDYLISLNKQTGPTAYVFRCLRCGKYQGYSDFS
jgi:uncharacterized protein CbrC (UPF0167 family)